MCLCACNDYFYFAVESTFVVLLSSIFWISCGEPRGRSLVLEGVCLRACGDYCHFEVVSACVSGCRRSSFSFFVVKVPCLESVAWDVLCFFWGVCLQAPFKNVVN